MGFCKNPMPGWSTLGKPCGWRPDFAAHRNGDGCGPGNPGRMRWNEPLIMLGWELRGATWMWTASDSAVVADSNTYQCALHHTGRGEGRLEFSLSLSLSPYFWFWGNACHRQNECKGFWFQIQPCKWKAKVNRHSLRKGQEILYEYPHRSLPWGHPSTLHSYSFPSRGLATSTN